MALQFLCSVAISCLGVLTYPTGAVSLEAVVNNNFTSFDNSTTVNNPTPYEETVTVSQPKTTNAFFDLSDSNDTVSTLDGNFSLHWTNESTRDTSSFDNEDPQTKKTDILGLVTEPIFFVTAVVGNSLSIRVLLGKDFRALPVSFTLVCLAVSDMIVTVLHPWNRPFFRELVKIDIRSIGGDAGCKAFYWVWKTAKMTSSWFVVFVCIERFLVVWCPLTVKKFSTRKKTLCGLLVIYLGICSYKAVWTFASGLNIRQACVPDRKAKGLEQITAAFLVGGTTLYSGLPSALVIIFTGLIIIKLIQSHYDRKQIAATSSDNSATVRITTMLVVIAIAYTILVNPHAILHNIAFARGEEFFETQSPGLKTGREVAQLMEQINYSINFFLYVLCSQQFRKRTAEILGLSRCFSIEGRETSTSHKTNSTVTF